MNRILQYFFSLSKRVIFFALICLAPSLAMLAAGYPAQTSFAVYQTLLLAGTPWLLWFQQMYYAGVGRHPKGLAHTAAMLASALFCAAAVSALFPFIPAGGRLSLDNIPAYSNPAPQDILAFPEGTLLLAPAAVMPVPAQTVAVWLGGRTLVFTNATTNGETLILKGTESIEATLRNTPPILNTGPVARGTADLWLQNVLGFPKKLESFYRSYGLGGLKENTSFSAVFAGEELPPAPEKSNPEGYLRFFLLLAGIYLLASLMGIVFSMHQNYLGALALICLCCWWASVFVMQLLYKISALFPTPYLFEGLLAGGSLLCVAFLCGFDGLFLGRLGTGSGPKKEARP